MAKKLITAIVNHTGTTHGFSFKQGEPVELSEDALKALGPDAYIVGSEQDTSEEEDLKKPKTFLDKAKDTMIHGNEKDLKTK